MKNSTVSTYFTFKDFKLENFTLQTIPVNKDKSKINLKRLPFDLDMDILTNENDNPENLEVFIRLNLTINKDKKPGYYIQATFLGFFRIKHIDKLDENIINQYIIFTALPIVISSSRIELRNLTQNALFGPYFLPTVDMKKLLKKLEQKQANQ